MEKFDKNSAKRRVENRGWSVTFVCQYLFCSSHFSFLVFGHLRQRSYENKKILLTFCLHFARQDGHDKNKGKKIMQLK